MFNVNFFKLLYPIKSKNDVARLIFNVSSYSNLYIKYIIISSYIFKFSNIK